MKSQRSSDPHNSGLSRAFCHHLSSRCPSLCLHICLVGSPALSHPRGSGPFAGGDMEAEADLWTEAGPQAF